TKPPAAGDATVYFWLRSDSRSDAAKKSIILMGTPLQLINSKAGEIMDPNSESPAKWYYIRVEATGETGWVYSAWVDRKP
ncbi:MAG: SH3 domain-containing protein, partial [Dehalococcoidia bacterium]|nr:SH3 domain-containing protein [Dehalococcoidia bacterium]